MDINITIFGQIISFVLFVWFCMKYVWLPLMSVIEKRQKEISDNLATAKHAKMTSDQMHSEAVACLNTARIKAQNIISNANTCRIQILDEAKCEANEEKNKILSQTRKQIVYERNCVIEELKKGFGQLVIEATEKVVEHSMNENIDHKLIDKIIKELSYDSKGEI